MGKFNKSYRIRTEVGKDTQVHVSLEHEYDILEIMSLKIDHQNAYRLHTSDYGVIAGRVLANDAFGIPNAKVSVFISIDENDNNDVVKRVLYPYHTTSTRNENNVKYNLLPNEQLTDCHTVIGSFPEKQYSLDNDSILEIFEKYYKFTTRTNDSGDYMIFGVPTGSHTIHVDIDLSDIGILSQKPRDMIYKGYNIGQFENPNKFKHDTNLNSLPQYVNEDKTVEVISFWGDNEEGDIGITRCDVNIQYKFEPTCVFMGSVVSDTSSNGISKKCIPSPKMGAMDEITTGSGTIEMIRKTPNGSVEEFQIQGTQLINGDGVWCYQIPMNLDYMMTDEFGAMVPTNDPNKGIPTRTKVRFRLSLQDFDSDNVNIFRGKMLIPHNPDIYSDSCEGELDYQFGTNTLDSSYRDLFWNGVYSVKSFIPRIQKKNNWRNEKFTGFKRVNYYGDKNPIPYNNIRIRIPFMYTILCTLIKMVIYFIATLNWLFNLCAGVFVGNKDEDQNKTSGSFLTLSGELCNDNLSNLCIIPGIKINKIAEKNRRNKTTLLGNAIIKHYNENGGTDLNHAIFSNETSSIKDKQSIDYQNKNNNSPSGQVIKPDSSNDAKNENDDKYKVTITGIRVTDSIDYLIQCVEMNLAQEFKVIQFDFYNDWLNGVIYIPRWARIIRKKYTFTWGGEEYTIGGQIKACNENYKGYAPRNIVQQCGLSYKLKNNSVENYVGCGNSGTTTLTCHKNKNVRKSLEIFKQGGLVRSVETFKSQYVYYYKPYENSGTKNVRLFATDIILLGTLNNCDKWGIPNDLTDLVTSSYQMPPSLALTDSDIEGNDYEASIDSRKKITMTINEDTARITDIELNDCYSGIKPMEENGNYTEVSGIDWGYTGPLQGEEDENSTALYKPGGHFLGISCRESETTIKSCVNLSRICELGVWMSQRQDLNIPSETTPNDNNIFPKSYATVPSGLISKDEISDTNYRRLFATMNYNKLRTKINPENGYLTYDFKTVTPTNFGGELYSHIIIDNEPNFNRKIADYVEEKDYNYLDDNGYQKDESSVKTKKINEIQIMRTGEFVDKEYLKFRFGYKDEDFDDSDLTEQKKRFLQTTSTSGSMPMYENSFYFYFGLRDGKTALDEFKKQYYAVCEKNNNLVQKDTSMYLNNLIVTYNGVCNNSASIEFFLKSALYDENGLLVYLYDSDDILINQKVIKNDKVKCVFSGLKEGEYRILCTTYNKQYQQDFPVTVKKIKITGNIVGHDFKKDVSNASLEVKFQGNRSVYGGYITFENDTVYYESSDIEQNEKLDVFSSLLIDVITISGRTQSISYTNDSNYPLRFNFKGLSVDISDSIGDMQIPVPYANETYDVYIDTFMDQNCRPTTFEKSYGIERWLIGTVEINNATPLIFSYNGVSYDSILKRYAKNTVSITDRNGWWNPIGINNWTYEPEWVQWRIKENLYQNDLTMPHKVIITNNGGVLPYLEVISGMSQNNLTNITSLNRSDFENVSIPTINYSKEDKQRVNFAYQLKDNNGIEPCQTTPDNAFIFPVIYKPFFMEMGVWFFSDANKYYLYGNVYNGKTWDYQNEGFNDSYFNNLLLNNIATIDKPDTTMEIDEPKELVGSDLGGYEYNGPHYKYNGRKVKINREIEPLTYGLQGDKPIKNLSVKIGSRHLSDTTLYSDSTNIVKDSIEFCHFTLTGQTFGSDYCIKMNINKENKDDFDLYAIYDNTESGYPYPWNGSINVSSLLMRDIIDGTLKEADLSSIETDGYINLTKVKEGTSAIYYIAVHKNNKEYVSSSNIENKITAISVSPLIRLPNLIDFYPLNINAVATDTLNEDGTYSTILTVTPTDSRSIDNFDGKKFVFNFYHLDINNNKIPTQAITFFGSLPYATINISMYRELIGVNSNDFIMFDYDVYNGTEKAPTTYTNNKMIINTNTI